MILFFDTETTGLVPNRVLPLDKQPEIIEFYGCLADPETGEVGRELELMIRPTRGVSAEITRITGISDADLVGSPRFPEVAPRIAELVAGASESVGHNVSFDMEVVDIEFERLGEKIAWPPATCTVEQTLHLRGFRLSLGALYEHLFGETHRDAHRARNDVEATLRCWFELRKRGEL